MTPPARNTEDQVRGDGRAARTLPPRVPQPHRRDHRLHALGKEEIRHIVGLQLDHVARNAASQGVTLTFDQTLIDHFAEEGYKPEFGARELKRLIRSELERRWRARCSAAALARAITPAPAGTTRPNGWSASARSHPRSRPSLRSPMPRSRPRRRRATRASLQEEVSGRRILSDGAVVSDPNGLTWAATLVRRWRSLSPQRGTRSSSSVTSIGHAVGAADRAVAAGRFAAVWAVLHQPLPAAGAAVSGQILLFGGPHAYDAPDRIGAVCRPGAPGGTCHRPVADQRQDRQRQSGTRPSTEHPGGDLGRLS